MKKTFFWLLVVYAATATALAAFAGWSVYNESYFVLSADQAETIVGKMNQLWFMYQSCRAGA